MWERPDCARCETGRGICRPNNSNSHEIMCLYQPQCKGGICKKRLIIGAVVLGILVLLATTATTIKVCHSSLLRREKEKESQLKVEKFLEDYKALKPLRYSYADIKKITNQFKTKLGEGGYGSVFKGFLPNGVPVAVKILLTSIGSNGEDFVNEVGTIGRIYHVNVVRLLGFCADGFKRALIYEFMPNESLAKFIFSVDGRSTLLGWDKLHNIAIGIARGIEYLHQGCDQRILHFDIKPHNVLLDDNFCPKISDFGLAKLCSKEQSIVSMTAARGTAGYIAPEVCSRNSGNVSYKSDVYSFGMLLLEMVGGRKNMDATVENTSQVYFPEWIYNRLYQEEELGLHIIEENDAIIARKLTIVALWCIQWYPVDRPSMKSVVQMLEGSMENLVMPPNPFTSAGPPNTHVALSDRRLGTNLTTIPEPNSEQEEV
ncbi:rust resistance kinase Lr10-like [Phoenix dactylifera]|uniref:Rust resistance kinase Lr10-like n=1 Tax=Phoenix dactylifera TaxID=42345 RepID=A0A8B8ZH07_PHODC|nr:rust resistance kinase Lr10-like [Phoenix dactylifera]